MRLRTTLFMQWNTVAFLQSFHHKSCGFWHLLNFHSAASIIPSSSQSFLHLPNFLVNSFGNTLEHGLIGSYQGTSTQLRETRVRGQRVPVVTSVLVTEKVQKLSLAVVELFTRVDAFCSCGSLSGVCSFKQLVWEWLRCACHFLKSQRPNRNQYSRIAIALKCLLCFFFLLF